MYIWMQYQEKRSSSWATKVGFPRCRMKYQKLEMVGNLNQKYLKDKQRGNCNTSWWKRAIARTKSLPFFLAFTFFLTKVENIGQVVLWLESPKEVQKLYTWTDCIFYFSQFLVLLRGLQCCCQNSDWMHDDMIVGMIMAELQPAQIRPLVGHRFGQS